MACGPVVKIISCPFKAHFYLEGEMVGEFLGHLGPVPFFLHGKPLKFKIFEKNQLFEKFQDF